MNLNKKVNVLIIVYIISYFAMTMISNQNGLNIFMMFGIQKNLVLDYHEYYRIITYSFAHASIMHLAFNMIALYSLADVVISFTSEKAAALIYAIAALVSGLGVLVFGGSNTVTVGASGAIYGLFGILIYFALKQRKYGYNDMLQSLIPIIVINLIISFMPNVSMVGHLFGLLSGLVGAYIYDRQKRRNYF